MDTHMYTKQYDSACLGSYGSFVMKDFVKKFIVLQIQTDPSRLQPASARCFPAVMITKCSIRETFIASCTDNIYDLENERWLLGDMIDHVRIYGSRVAEGLSAFYVGLVLQIPLGERSIRVY